MFGAAKSSSSTVQSPPSIRGCSSAQNAGSPSNAGRQPTPRVRAHRSVRRSCRCRPGRGRGWIRSCACTLHRCSSSHARTAAGSRKCVMRRAGFALADQHAQPAMRVDHREAAFIGEVVADEHRHATAERRFLQQRQDRARPCRPRRDAVRPRGRHAAGGIRAGAAARLRRTRATPWPPGAARQCRPSAEPLSSTSAPGPRRTICPASSWIACNESGGGGGGARARGAASLQSVQPGRRQAQRREQRVDARQRTSAHQRDARPAGVATASAVSGAACAAPSRRRVRRRNPAGSRRRPGTGPNRRPAPGARPGDSRCADIARLSTTRR